MVKNEGRNVEEAEGYKSHLSLLWKEVREKFETNSTVHVVQCTYVRTYIRTSHPPYIQYACL